MNNTYTIEELMNMSDRHPIVAFDGVCNLCNGYINWLIKRDRKKVFRYTTLQSDTGQIFQSEAGANLDSVILAYKGKIYTLSDVALECMLILGGGWRVLSYFTILPKGFRDSIYHFIAKNRYKWFGKKDVCMMPSPEMRELFL